MPNLEINLHLGGMNFPMRSLYAMVIPDYKNVFNGYVQAKDKQHAKEVMAYEPKRNRFHRRKIFSD
ncbi:hypothetical protein [Scytonema sp. HK-05]|uniref:hypothetical protein n=1 Tax=Scytonema sp. HK-05 TaxID=1137095 RepID=UPI0011610F2A|nr:hypothetical protein [Scytonema sp. HK-05]